MKEKAAELGAKFPHSVGIGWTYAGGFPNTSKAQEFVRCLESSGYQHGGVCTASGMISVKYRK